MTQEEKDLLLKDLCARLPHHVRVKVWLKDGTIEEGLFDFEHNYGDVMMDFFFYNKLKDLKPYLRPIYSMTKEEAEEFYKVTGNIFKFYPGCKIYDHIPAFDNNCTSFDTFDDEYEYKRVKPENVIACIDFLNRHHFDYRGLINLGLALEAKEGMYDVN